MVPEHFLVEFFEVKNKITQHVIENYPKPENYDFLRDLLFMTQSIGHRKLNLTYTDAARDCTNF